MDCLLFDETLDGNRGPQGSRNITEGGDVPSDPAKVGWEEGREEETPSRDVTVEGVEGGQEVDQR